MAFVARKLDCDRRLFTLLLVATLLKGVLWSSLIPLWHAPDEMAHFAYAQAISRTGRAILPPLQELPLENFILNDLMQVDRVAFNRQVPLDFADEARVNALKQQLSDPASKTTFRRGSTVYLTVYHPPSYYVLAAVVLSLLRSSDILAQMALLRLLSVALGLATVAAAYLAARTLLPADRFTPLAIATLVSFQPMITVNSSTVSNHALEIFLFTLALWLVIRAVRYGLSWPGALALGLAVGLGVLTRIGFLAVLPPLGLLALWDIFREKARRTSKLFRWLLLAALIAVMASFWYGQPMRALEQGPSGAPGGAEAVSLDSFIGFLRSHNWRKYTDLFGMYWAIFGWNDTIMPLGVYYVILAVCLLALLGWGVRWWRYLRRDGPERPAAWQIVALLLLGLAALFLVLEFLVIEYLQAYVGRSSFYTQGRYYLAAIVAHMIFLALGVSAFFSRNWRGPVAALLAVLMILLNGYCLGGVVVPRYYYPLTYAGQGQYELELFSPVGELTAGRTVGQTFTAEADGLYRVDVQLATYGRDNRGKVRFHLRRSPAAGVDIAAVEFDAAGVVDDADRTFLFPRQAHSAGRSYYFFFDTPDGQPGKAITVRGVVSGPDRYPGGSLYINDEPVTGDLTFVPYFDGGLPLLFKRFATFQPRFYTCSFFAISVPLGGISAVFLACFLPIESYRRKRKAAGANNSPVVA
jgi:hypothetical protein